MIKRSIYIFLFLLSYSFANSSIIISQLVDYTLSKAVIFVLATFVSIMISVVGFYISELTANQQAKINSKREIQATVINAILFVLFVGIVNAMDILDVLLLGNNPNSNILDFWDNVKTDYENTVNFYTSIVRNLTEAIAVMKMMSSYGLSGQIALPAVFHVSINIGTSFYTRANVYGEIAAALDQILFFIFSSLALVSSLIAFGEYSFKAAFAFLIPFGFVLRAFPFSRRIGSTFLAFGMAVGFIYPSMLYIGIEFFRELHNTFEYDGKDINGLAQAALTLRGRLAGMFWELHGFAFNYNIAGSGFLNGAIYLANSLFNVCMGASFGLAYFVCKIVKFITGALPYYILFAVNSVAGIHQSFQKGLLLDIIMQALLEIAFLVGMLTLSSIFVLVLVSLSILGFTRSLSLLLGGEFFLYGVQDYV